MTLAGPAGASPPAWARITVPSRHRAVGGQGGDVGQRDLAFVRPAVDVHRLGPEHDFIQMAGNLREPPGGARKRLGADLPRPRRILREGPVDVVRPDPDQRAGARRDQRDRSLAAGLAADDLYRGVSRQPFDRDGKTGVAHRDDQAVEHDVGREHALGGIDVRPVDETRAHVAPPPWLG